jgi:predicted amidophosphoribosyltransferase
MAEIDQIRQRLGVATKEKAAPPKAAHKPVESFICPHCRSKFEQALKFCGECGKPMTGGAA